jgi:hypothetical protein
MHGGFGLESQKERYFKKDKDIDVRIILKFVIDT